MKSNSFSVIQISDIHFGRDDPRSFGRFAAIRRRINEINPQLTVMAGDLCNDPFDEHGLEELRRAKAQLDRIEGSVAAVPGNHDVGDQLGGKRPTSAENLERWNRVFDNDHFCIEHGRWMLIGLDSQVLASELPQADEQWSWFDDQLERAAASDCHVAVFTHVPPFVLEADDPYNWCWPAEPRQRILERLDRPQVRLVSAAHIHWRCYHERGNAKWLISPPVTEIVIDHPKFPTGGDVVGFLKFDFSAEDVSYEVIEVGRPSRRIWFSPARVDIPGRGEFTLGRIALDFTGTLAEDGALLPGVVERIKELADKIKITVMTADTFGTAAEALKGLPVELKMIETGADKERFVREFGSEFVVAIGNGRNDVDMVRAAAIGIAIVGPEGAAGELIREADIVVRDVLDAFDLISNPLRMKATLRS